MRHPIQPSPSDLFDAAFHRRHDDQFDALGLEVVARPGDPVPLNADDDLLVVRRALGENRLAIIAEVHRIVEGRGSLEAQGIECEGYGEGIFAEVADSRSRRKGRRIAGMDGLVVRDSLLVRRRRTPPDQPVAEPAVPFDFDRPDLPNPPDPPNPPDLIDDVHDLPPLEHSTEAITDPITPPRRPLAISATVGRGGRNNAPDVKAVQDRLLELRALEPNDATTERPASAAPVAETALTQTIEAIERFQRQLGIPVDGTVDVSSPTRLELDQAIGLPTAAELAAIATARNTIAQSVSRGLTIKGPVGATTTGNMPDDVRAVQRRLVEIGKLSSSHIEAPPAAATAAVTQANLPATIRSLRAMQSDVEFWTAKGTITGSSTAGLVSPGDATAALLDRISVYSMTLGPHRVSFRDHIVSGNTRSDAGVMFVGTASPSTLPLADYRAVGLSPAQAAALKQVSAHEGSFDAINTYDRALVSAGFIQFAGSRGLPRYLALLKARHEAKFRDLLHKFGIDVEFSVKGRAIDTARVVVLDPGGNRVLRATAAEAAIRDDKRLTTALIVSGRDRDVQLTQLEAAVRDYVLPILNATVSWGAGAARAALKDLCRSQKGMAALFDRCIQEGLGAARRRFERVIQRLVAAAPPAPTRRATPPPLTDLQRREGDILAEVERDLQAAADVANRLARARTLLSRLIRDTRTAGATPAGIVARPELTDVRQAVREARVAVPGIVNLTTPSGVTVEAALEAMKNSLAAEETRLAMTPMPESRDAVRAALVASRQALANVLGPVATAPMFLARIQRIRRSTLDASLGPAEVELTA